MLTWGRDLAFRGVAFGEPETLLLKSYAVGNGKKTQVWNSRRVPRPFSCHPIPLPSAHISNVLVADLIDKERGEWREDLVRSYFIPNDANMVLQIPLCTSWSEARLIWHFTSTGKFTVSSAYYHTQALKSAERASSSTDRWRDAVLEEDLAARGPALGKALCLEVRCFCFAYQL